MFFRCRIVCTFAALPGRLHQSMRPCQRVVQPSLGLSGFSFSVVGQYVFDYNHGRGHLISLRANVVWVGTLNCSTFALGQFAFAECVVMLKL